MSDGEYIKIADAADYLGITTAALHGRNDRGQTGIREKMIGNNLYLNKEDVERYGDIAPPLLTRKKRTKNPYHKGGNYAERFGSDLEKEPLECVCPKCGKPHIQHVVLGLKHCRYVFCGACRQQLNKTDVINNSFITQDDNRMVI